MQSGEAECFIGENGADFFYGHVGGGGTNPYPVCGGFVHGPHPGCDSCVTTPRVCDLRGFGKDGQFYGVVRHEFHDVPAEGGVPHHNDVFRFGVFGVFVGECLHGQGVNRVIWGGGRGFRHGGDVFQAGNFPGLVPRNHERATGQVNGGFPMVDYKGWGWYFSHWLWWLRQAFNQWGGQPHVYMHLLVVLKHVPQVMLVGNVVGF